jgi:hypothetical protein
LEGALDTIQTTDTKPKFWGAFGSSPTAPYQFSPYQIFGAGFARPHFAQDLAKK